MNPKSYHTPPHPISTRVRCPVCHQEVYSRAGIHPQCAVRQCDPPKPKNRSKGPAGQPEAGAAGAVPPAVAAAPDGLAV
jgi:hypothetical protein